MKVRVLTAIVGIAVLAAILFGFDTIIVELALIVLNCIAFNEVFQVMGFGKKQWYLFLPFAVAAVVINLCPMPVLTLAIWPLLVAFVVYLAVCLVVKHAEISFEKLGGMVLFSGVILLGFYSLLFFKRALPAAQYHKDGVYFILLGLCFAWGGDTGAYFAGRAFGKHKLAPVVSPKKTVEGAVGGVAGSIVVGLLLSAIFRAVMGENTLLAQVDSWFYPALAVVGAFASVLGIFGDLFASVVKRQHGIKDYGNLFPGHGGVLDRFDSVLLITPLVAAAVRLALAFGLF